MEPRMLIGIQESYVFLPFRLSDKFELSLCIKLFYVIMYENYYGIRIIMTMRIICNNKLNN